MIVNKANVYDLEESISASKYPMSLSVDKCSSEITQTVVRLGQSGKGEGHDQWLTGIRVAFDLRCSNKMWIELERYRFLEFVSSQSTMHRITKFDIAGQCNEYVSSVVIAEVQRLVNVYKESPTAENYLSVLYNVPSGFELTARLTTNYRALKTVYYQRNTHRLPEWKAFCEWCLTLPYFKELCLGENDD